MQGAERLATNTVMGGDGGGGDGSNEDEGEMKRISVGEAFPQCAKELSKLRQCMRHHPSQSPTSVVCERLATSLGWCITLSLCGRQARELEACCGGIPELVSCKRRHCRGEHRQLDRCMQQFTTDPTTGRPT